MGRILFFLLGFILSTLKMLLGSAVICAIVGFIFLPALYVLIPLCIISIIIEGFKGGINRAGDYLSDKKHRKQQKKDHKHIKRLKRIFKEEELYEFDKAWQQTSKH